MNNHTHALTPFEVMEYAPEHHAQRVNELIRLINQYLLTNIGFLIRDGHLRVCPLDECEDWDAYHEDVVATFLRAGWIVTHCTYDATNHPVYEFKLPGTLIQAK